MKKNFVVSFFLRKFVLSKSHFQKAENDVFGLCKLLKIN